MAAVFTYTCSLIACVVSTCKSSAVVILRLVTASIKRDRRATIVESSFFNHALDRHRVKCNRNMTLTKIDRRTNVHVTSLPLTDAITGWLKRIGRAIAYDGTLQL
jgi:hypothetical protein